MTRQADSGQTEEAVVEVRTQVRVGAEHDRAEAPRSGSRVAGSDDPQKDMAQSVCGKARYRAPVHGESEWMGGR